MTESRMPTGAGSHTTPENSDAQAVGAVLGIFDQSTADTRNCTEASAERKRAASATANAAMLGIEARPQGDGAWLLCHAKGAPIGTVHGLDALCAAVAGFEAAANDVRQLVQRMRGGAAA